MAAPNPPTSPNEGSFFGSLFGRMVSLVRRLCSQNPPAATVQKTDAAVQHVLNDQTAAAGSGSDAAAAAAGQASPSASAPPKPYVNPAVAAAIEASLSSTERATLAASRNRQADSTEELKSDASLTTFADLFIDGGGAGPGEIVADYLYDKDLVGALECKKSLERAQPNHSKEAKDIDEGLKNIAALHKGLELSKKSHAV